jgi:hypothetical protein
MASLFNAIASKLPHSSSSSSAAAAKKDAPRLAVLELSAAAYRCLQTRVVVTPVIPPTTTTTTTTTTVDDIDNELAGTSVKDDDDDDDDDDVVKEEGTSSSPSSPSSPDEPSIHTHQYNPTEADITIICDNLAYIKNLLHVDDDNSRDVSLCIGDAIMGGVNPITDAVPPVPSLIPTLLLLVVHLSFEGKKDVASIFCSLLRSDADYFAADQSTAADAAAAAASSFTTTLTLHFSIIIKLLVEMHNKSSTALVCGTMIRAIIRASPSLYHKLLFEECHLIWTFVDVYVHVPNFDVASDSFSTVRDILTFDKKIAATFIFNNYDAFLTTRYQTLLMSTNYITRRLSLKLLAELLLDRK